MKTILTAVVFSFVTLTSFAQLGTINGQVVDHKTSEAIIGGNVVIEGTTVGAGTDIEGNFSIPKVKPGTYTLVVTYLSYKTQTIPDVVVEAGKITTLKIMLVEDIAELEEVVVTATREVNNDVSLMNTIKDNKLVVSGISAQQITKLPDRDAAQVMMRVPGVTIQDGRFVLVRGLPERYNQVMMNGIIAPSTEIDKRSFSFDLVPAGALDQMLVYKSSTAELPGDFAGGVIQMVTKSPGYDEFTSVGLNFGYRTNTTFGDFYKSNTSSTDIIGFDNGARSLPSSFPSTDELRNSSRASSFREAAGKSLSNTFALNKRTAAPDMGFNFTTSQNFKVGNIELGNLTSVAYSNSFTHYGASFDRYNQFDQPVPNQRFHYQDEAYSNEVRVTGMHNWLVRFNNRNKIEFKNMFVQTGEDKTILRTGNDTQQLSNADWQNYAYHYLSRSIYTGQLEGTHQLGDASSKINWVLGANYINRNEPDYRRFRTHRDITARGTEEPFQVQLPPNGNLFEAGRFYSSLFDKGFSHGLNFEKKFGDINAKRVVTLKAGYFLEQKTRDFNARYVNYVYPNFSDGAEGDRLTKLPIDQVFSPENVKSVNGFVVEEGTQPTDRYHGQNTYTSGYVSGLFPVGKLDLSVGFRAEYNVQTMSRTKGAEKFVNNPVFAPLPSFNVAYNTSDRSLVRLAYGRTVNRPEFRELAPFLYYQFELEAALIGNPDLKTAFVNNLDLRYEFYPNPGETFSVGGFYKQMNDPIEMYLAVTSDVPQLTYNNSKSAYVYGAEVKFRKSLASLGVSKFLRNTSLNINASYIKSQVDIGSGAGGNLARYRPLQGQSPYIINGGVYYNDEESGFSVNVAYNVFGPRIYSVGDINFPTLWEMPRQAVDIQVSKKITKSMSIKLNAQNLLNSPFRILQDSNLDQEISKSDFSIQRYRVGTQYSLALNWMFMKN